jgi:hypothetical protein
MPKPVSFVARGNTGAYPPDFDPRTLERIVLGCRLRYVRHHRDQKEQRCPAGTDAQGFPAAHQDGAIALSPDIAAEIAASLRRD